MPKFSRYIFFVYFVVNSIFTVEKNPFYSVFFTILSILAKDKTGHVKNI